MSLVRPTDPSNVVQALVATIDLLERRPTWTEFPTTVYRNGWTNSGTGVQGVHYMKDQFGFVQISGEVQKSSNPAGSPEKVIDLPPELRPNGPPHDQWFPQSYAIGGAMASSDTLVANFSVAFDGVYIEDWSSVTGGLHFIILQLLYKAAQL